MSRNATPDGARHTRSSGPAVSTTQEIASHPVLGELSGQEQQAVAEHAKILPLERDQLLFSEGDPARAFFICRSGQIKLYRLAPNGAEKIVAMIDPGSSFAEAAVFMQQASYPVHAQAVRASTVVRIDANHLLGLLRESPDGCIHLLGLISTRLRNRVADIEALSLQNGQLRVMSYLLRLHRQSEPIELPASKKSVANLLAITPETFSRVLTQLQDTSVISVDRRRIHVLDPERLAALAEGREAL